MPARLELTGKIFGQLTVIGPAGNRMWRCQCSCGRVEIIYQYWLTTSSVSRQFRSCHVCRRGPCVICGGPIEWDKNKSNVCSDICMSEKRKSAHRRGYYKKIQDDPEHNIKRYAKIKERMQEDPAFRARHLAYWRNNSQAEMARIKADPELHKQYLDEAARQYAKNRDRILAQRKARNSALSDAEREALAEKNRKTGREWRRKWRAELEQNPEKKQAYMLYLIELRRQRALKKLFGISNNLHKMVSENDE